MTTLEYKSETSQRLQQVMNWIEENQTHWDQSQWHCGASHCFAGIAQMFAWSIDPKLSVQNESTNNSFRSWMCENGTALGLDKDVHLDATMWLRITASESRRLFNFQNDLETLRQSVRDLCESYG